MGKGVRRARIKAGEENGGEGEGGQRRDGELGGGGRYTPHTLPCR